MREHRYSFEMPHSAARIWALFQDYDRWTDYAPMVKRVDVLWPGDDAPQRPAPPRHLQDAVRPRRAPRSSSCTDVEPERGYTFTMISRDAGNDQTGKVRLEPIGPNRTRFSFEERYHLTKAPWKWFEGPIYGFINKQNEESMRRASRVAHRAPRVPRRPRGARRAVEPSSERLADRPRS